MQLPALSWNDTEADVNAVPTRRGEPFFARVNAWFRVHDLC